MHGDRLQVAYTLSSFLSVYGVAYMVMAFSFPATFLRFLTISRVTAPREQLSPRARDVVLHRIRCVLTVLALIYFVYRASESLVDWMPFDWGYHDEDDEWQPARDITRIWLVVAGAPWAIISAEAAAVALNVRNRPGR